jgi:hypothetical protein
VSTDPVRIHIPVLIPSKKNMLKPRAPGSRGRAYHYDTETSALLDATIAWLRKAWAPRLPVESPLVQVHYFVLHRRQDRDGIWTTVLDCCKKAGVIHDDNIRWFNGYVIHHPAVLVGHQRDAGVVLEVRTGGAWIVEALQEKGATNGD